MAFILVSGHKEIVIRFADAMHGKVYASLGDRWLFCQTGVMGIMDNPSVSSESAIKNNQGKPSREDLSQSAEEKRGNSLKTRLQAFDTKIGYAPKDKKKDVRSLNTKELLIWVIFVLLMSFSVTSPLGLYCIWRKLKHKPTIPKRFKWIPTFGNPVPKEGYRDISNQGSVFDRLFRAPAVTATNQKWLMILGVFVLIIGLGLTVNPLGTYIIYGFTPDVLWQYVQCFCIMLAGSFLFRASVRIKTEHTRMQGVYLLSSRFSALPLSYMSAVFSAPERLLADDLQTVIDVDLLGNSFVDYQHLIYDAGFENRDVPEKKKRRMAFFSNMLKDEIRDLDIAALSETFLAFDKEVQKLVNRSFENETLFKHSVEYLDFYYPLVINLARGGKQIKNLGPSLTDDQLKDINKKGRRKRKRQDAKNDPEYNPERVVMQFAFDKKDVGLSSVSSCMEEINEQIAVILENL